MPNFSDRPIPNYRNVSDKIVHASSDPLRSLVQWDTGANIVRIEKVTERDRPPHPTIRLTVLTKFCRNHLALFGKSRHDIAMR